MKLEGNNVVFNRVDFVFFSALVGTVGRNLTNFPTSKHIAPSLFAATIAATKRLVDDKSEEIYFSKELVASWAIFILAKWNTPVFLDGSPNEQMFYTCVPPAFIFPFLRIAYAIEEQYSNQKDNDNPKGLSMN